MTTDDGELGLLNGDEISVDVTTGDVTATAGTDYVANSQTLTFNVGTGLSINFDVTVNGDDLVEDTETFDVFLSNPLVVTDGEPSGDDVASVSLTSGSGLATIADNDIATVSIAVTRRR